MTSTLESRIKAQPTVLMGGHATNVTSTILQGLHGPTVLMVGHARKTSVTNTIFRGLHGPTALTGGHARRPM